MNSFSNRVKVNIRNGVSVIVLLGLVSCTSKPQVIPLPDCNYTAHLSANEQLSRFIWRDKQHVTFNADWQQSSLVEVANRYQYLQRKALTDAIKAKKEIVWLESKLNSLAEINQKLLTQIEMQLCNNRHQPHAPSVLEQQNAGIAYLLSGIPEIKNDIQAKTEKIVSAIESK